MSEEVEAPKKKIKWSPEKIMSTSALVVSVVSVVALFYQLNLAREENELIRKQQSASVLPHLSLLPTLGPEGYRISFVNKGVGPAFIKEVEFGVEGGLKFQRSDFFYNHVNNKVYEADSVSVPLSTYSFMEGDVISANESINILTIRGEQGVNLIRNYLSSIDWYFSITYEDVYGARWKLSSDSRFPVALGK